MRIEFKISNTNYIWREDDLLGMDGLHKYGSSNTVMDNTLYANYDLCKYTGKKYLPNCLDKKLFKQCKPHLPYRQPIPHQMENQDYHLWQNF